MLDFCGNIIGKLIGLVFIIVLNILFMLLLFLVVKGLCILFNCIFRWSEMVEDLERWKFMLFWNVYFM